MWIENYIHQWAPLYQSSATGLGSAQMDTQPTLIFLLLLNILGIVHVLTWAKKFCKYICIPKQILIENTKAASSSLSKRVVESAQRPTLPPVSGGAIE